MNAVIYARYSSDSQREESIEGQLRECREYAERNNMTIVGTYIDRALSAKTADRPEFQHMIKDSAKELFEIVLVWKLDRFSRDRYDSAHYKHILKKNGVKVISAKEHISEGPEGIILEAMLEGYTEFYSAELSEKIHRGQKENALKGKNNGGGVPLGYLLDKKAQKLAIDPTTAPLVVEVFEKYADGKSVRSIVEDLNVRGLRTKKGQPFNINSFSSLLKNRKYIGEYRYQDVVIEGGVPAIVPEDLFNRVQERMEKNRFSVCDVDGDGAEELILLYTTAITAAQRGFIFSCEEETGKLGIQLESYPLFTFYKSGAVEGGWSHNQGKGNTFWPYDLYRYDSFLDVYVDVGSVDAWDESLGIEDYPSQADKSGSGFVYYIETNGSMTWEDPLDVSIYEAWRYPYVRDGQEILPEYLPLTAENIQSLLTAG